MSASAQTLSQYGAIRIVSLPSGYETYDSAKYLVEQVLDLGRVSDLRVKRINQPNGATYYTATVEFHYWAQNPFSVWLQTELIRVIDESSDPDKVSIQIPSECIATKPSVDPNSANVPIGSTKFRFSNGKPMSHLSVRAVKVSYQPIIETDSLVGAEPLFYADQQPEMWSSIYIPVIAPSMYYQGKWMGDHSTIPLLEANLKMMFEENMCLGSVSRIDFVKEEKDEKITLKAFVHFSWWSKVSLRMRDTMERDGQIRLWGLYSQEQGKVELFRKSPDDYYGQSAVFLPIRINHKPLPAATGILNVHQLSAIVKEKTEQIDFLLPKTADLLERLTAEGCVTSEEGEVIEEKLKEIEQSNAKGKA